MKKDILLTRVFLLCFGALFCTNMIFPTTAYALLGQAGKTQPTAKASIKESKESALKKNSSLKNTSSMLTISQVKAALSKINLSAEQKKKVQQIDKQFQEEMRTSMKSFIQEMKEAKKTGKKVNMREKMGEAYKKYANRIETVLTPAQKKQFRLELKKLQEKREANMKKNMIPSKKAFSSSPLTPSKASSR